MFLRDRQVVDFQGSHIRLDGFLDVGQRGIVRFALVTQPGRLGHSAIQKPSSPR